MKKKKMVCVTAVEPRGGNSNGFEKLCPVNGASEGQNRALTVLYVQGYLAHKKQPPPRTLR